MIDLGPWWSVVCPTWRVGKKVAGGNTPGKEPPSNRTPAGVRGRVRKAGRKTGKNHKENKGDTKKIRQDIHLLSCLSTSERSKEIWKDQRKIRRTANVLMKMNSLVIQKCMLFQQNKGVFPACLGERKSKEKYMPPYAPRDFYSVTQSLWEKGENWD